MKTEKQKVGIPKGRAVYEVGGTQFVIDEKY